MKEVRRVVEVMSVAEGVYRVPPNFKKVKSDKEGRERQIHKYLMRVYLEIMREVKETDGNMGEA